jgi:Tfp pilus assembly protein PilW
MSHDRERHMNRQERWSGQRGTSFVDILAALALLATISLGVFLAFRAGLTSWLTIQQFAGEQQNGRAAVNKVGRSLRMLGYNYAPTPTSPALIYADAHEVDFLADLDNTGTPQCYRFYLNNEAVNQAKVTGAGCNASITSAVGQPLTAPGEAKALRFTELDFSYWSAADLGGGQLTDTPLTLSDRNLVRRISVTVKVRGLSAGENPVTITTQTVVRQGG